MSSDNSENFNKEKYKILKEYSRCYSAIEKKFNNVDISNLEKAIENLPTSEKNFFKKFLSNKTKEQFPDLEEKTSELMKKYNIPMVEAIALYLRDCNEDHMLCKHCYENKTTFISIVKGWKKYCSKPCQRNSTVVKLRNLTKEERLKTTETRKKYGFKSFEQARYFLDYNIAGRNCKLCKRPTRFINYTFGYHVLCDMCSQEKGKYKKNKPMPQNPEGIVLVRERLKEFGDEICYDTKIKYNLKKMSQALWHLERNDKSCVLGCCPHCGKRYTFRSYLIGYRLSNSCKCKINKKIYVMKRIPPPRTLQEYYERSFLNAVNRFATMTYNEENNLKREIQKERFSRTGSGEQRRGKSRSETLMNLVKKWGGEGLNNPIVVSKLSDVRINLGPAYAKSRLIKNNSDPEVFDFSNDPNWWYQLYKIDGMNIDEISYYTGLSTKLIKSRLRKFNLLKDENLEEEFEKNYEEDDDDDFQDLMMPLF